MNKNLLIVALAVLTMGMTISQHFRASKILSAGASNTVESFMVGQLCPVLAAISGMAVEDCDVDTFKENGVNIRWGNTGTDEAPSEGWIAISNHNLNMNATVISP